MSAADTADMTPDDWECLYENQFVFAILQAWHGGMGYNDHIGNDSIQYCLTLRRCLSGRK